MKSDVSIPAVLTEVQQKNRMKRDSSATPSTSA